MGQYNDKRRNNVNCEGIYQLRNINPKIGTEKERDELHMGMHFINDPYFETSTKKSSNKGVNVQIQTDFLIIAIKDILPNNEIFARYENNLTKLI